MKHNLEGERFGYLVVISKASSNNRGNSWLCKCDCGNEVVLRQSYLLSSKNRNSTRSCGCKAKRQNGDSLRFSRLYSIYTGMLQRCYYPLTGSYNYYGEKGIQVCDEWRNSWKLFSEWAFQNGYKNNLSLDRIDAAKNYEPNNCRWVSNEVQAITKRVGKNSRTGIKGVCPLGDRFRAYISIGGKRIYLGVHDNIEDAIKARKEAEEKYHKPLIAKYTNIE